jgi:hypothetical protein
MNTLRQKLTHLWLLITALALTISASSVVTQGNGLGKVSVATNTAVAPAPIQTYSGSTTWAIIYSPFAGDVNSNSYTTYEYGLFASGLWTSVCDNGIPGGPAWRTCAFGGLSPSTNYFVRVTFNDADGVIGPNPRIVSVQTRATSTTAVSVRPMSVLPRRTHLLVVVPINDDANMNSQLASVEIATSADGSWTQKCGPYTSFNPKLCRVHGLTTNTNYWIRTTVTDPDGINGSGSQVIGPILYTGLTSLALNKIITADPGWGCCSNPAELVDGRIQNPYWSYGFAWCGGASSWGGCGPGLKQATIDLGSLQTVARLDFWAHDPASFPTTWQVLVSTDGVTYTEVFANAGPQCRTDTLEFGGIDWSFPACCHSARFGPPSVNRVESLDD